MQKQLTTGRGDKDYPYRKDNGRATNILSELYDSDGNLISTGMSNTSKADPEGLFGDVHCSEGNGLINGRPLMRGQTYNLYTTQGEGLPACPVCDNDLQQAADNYGININVYSIDANGVARNPVLYAPSAPVNPAVEEEDVLGFVEEP
ncbi:MAG: hypothetical protein ACRDHZ_23860 [Ktedonobacteraceae bacterium]